MKKLYILLITVLASGAAWTQNKVWNGPVNGGSWTTAANWSGNSIPNSGDVVEFGVGVSGTIINVPHMSISGLVVSGGANITLVKPAAAATNTLTIANTTAANEFVITEGSSLILGNGVNITLASGTGANPNRSSIAGELNVAGRTFNTNNSNVTTTVQSTGVLNVGDDGAVTSTNAARLIFAGNATYIHGRNGGTIPTATWGTTSITTIAGVSSAAPSGMGQAFANLTWDNPNQTADADLPGNGMSVAGSFSVNATGTSRLKMDQTPLNVGNFNLNGGTFQIADGFDFFIEIGVSRTLNVSGNMVMNGGTLLMSTFGTAFTQGNGIINLDGNFTQNGGLINEVSGSRGEINFTGTSVQTFTKSPTAAITNDIDFAISNNAIVDFGTSVLDGSAGTFSLSNGGKLITSHPHGLRSTGTIGSIQVGGTRTFGEAADYEFRGATTGTFATTGNRVRDLIINNTASNQVSTGRAFMVDRTLVLAYGYVTPAAGELTINTNGTATTTNGAFVNGQLGKVTANTNAFTFPVGKIDGGLRIIGIKPTSNSNSRFTAEFFRAPAPAGTLATGLTRVSGCEYWNLSRPTGTAPATVTLSWANNSGCSPTSYVTDATSLRVAHLSGGVWRNEGRISSTGNNSAGTVTSQLSVSTFSPFALGSSIESENPLPVVFANVRAYEKNNGVQIEWSNLTEKDVAGYVIERSANGTDFAAIGQQAPTSNQDDRADYSAFDASPLAGTNYYRVKAEETTGKIVYSKVLSVSLGLTTQSLRLYPNPVKGSQVNISLSNIRGGQYDLRVVNMAGQDIVKQRISSQGSTITETIDLPAAVAPGVYHMIITGADYREVKKFIVQ